MEIFIRKEGKSHQGGRVSQCDGPWPRSPALTPQDTSRLVLFLHLDQQTFPRISKECYGPSHHLKTSTATGSQTEILPGVPLGLLPFVSHRDLAFGGLHGQTCPSVRNVFYPFQTPPNLQLTRVFAPLFPNETQGGRPRCWSRWGCEEMRKESS